MQPTNQNTGVVVVTGATSPIGQSICQTFQQHGYRVLAGFYRNQQAANALTHQTNLPTLAWDARDPQVCIEAFAHIKKAHGYLYMR